MNYLIMANPLNLWQLIWPSKPSMTPTPLMPSVKPFVPQKTTTNNLNLWKLISWPVQPNLSPVINPNPSQKQSLEINKPIIPTNSLYMSKDRQKEILSTLQTVEDKRYALDRLSQQYILEWFNDSPWEWVKVIGDKINTPPEKNLLQKVLTPAWRFYSWIADLWQWISEGIDTWLTKLWVISDQTEKNKAMRILDEWIRQEIFWKKAWYEDTAQEVWRFIGSMAMTPPISKWLQGAKLLTRTLWWAAEWLLWWASYNISTGEWVWSPLNLWVATVIWWAVPLAWPTLKGIWKLASKVSVGFGKTAEWLAVKWLLNANDAKKIVRTLKETGEWDVWSLWRRALERKIAWKSTEEALDTAKNIATTNYKWVRTAVSEVSDKLWWLWKDIEVIKAMTMVWKQADAINTRVWYDAIDKIEIDWLLAKATDWTLDLNWKQRAKELIDQFVNIYKKSWDVADTQIADVADGVRQNIRKSIEDIVDYTTDWKINIREMNREVAVAKAFEQWIQNKATANELKQFAIQWTIGGVMSNQWDFTSPEWWVKFISWAFLWRLAGRVLGDPQVLWKVAKIVDKLSMWSRKWLLEYIKKPTVQLSDDILREIVPIRNEIKNLALTYKPNVTIPNIPLYNTPTNKALLEWSIAVTPPKQPLTPPPTPSTKNSFANFNSKQNLINKTKKEVVDTFLQQNRNIITKPTTIPKAPTQSTKTTPKPPTLNKSPLEQANNSTKIDDSLLTEARKYKSADEFIGNVDNSFKTSVWTNKFDKWTKIIVTNKMNNWKYEITYFNSRWKPKYSTNIDYDFLKSLWFDKSQIMLDNMSTSKSQLRKIREEANNQPPKPPKK